MDSFPGSVLIDNLTLQSVAYLLLHQAGGADDAPGFVSTRGRAAWADGRDEALALDLTGLCAFVQAVVLNERVHYVREYAMAWTAVDADVGGQLADFVSPLQHDGLPDHDPDANGLDRGVLDALRPATRRVLEAIGPEAGSELRRLAGGYDFSYAFSRDSPRARNYSLALPGMRTTSPLDSLGSGGLFYEMLSRTWNIPIVLHPARSALLRRLAGPDVASAASANAGFAAAEGRLMDASGGIDGAPMSVSLLAPALISRVITGPRRLDIARFLRSGDADCILDRIRALRDDRDAIAYRQHLQELDRLIAAGDVAALRRFQVETDGLVASLARRMNGGEVAKLTIGVGGLGFEKALRLPRWATRPLAPSRLVFLHDVLDSMTSLRALARWCAVSFGFDPEDVLVRLRAELGI